MKKTFLINALIAGLIAGSLDISAAFIQYFIQTGKNPVVILPFIASGVFGNEAFNGENSMILSGLIFHFIIAIIFAIFFFWLSKKFPSILKNKLFTGVLYGIFIWSVMRFLVLPLSQVPKSPLHFTSAIIAILILIVCIGIPLAYLAGRKRSE
ncbi:MAG TPA: DUF1440 domain-containing protein [Puia sp.]|jgi:hypothetical protein|nr:DUF1440 domain-containing protein [Puia sp.]